MILDLDEMLRGINVMAPFWLFGARQDLLSLKPNENETINFVDWEASSPPTDGVS